MTYFPVYSESRQQNIFLVVPDCVFSCSPDKVAEGILELITDTTKSGAVMTVTLAKGLKYQRLFGDPPKPKL